MLSALNERDVEAIVLATWCDLTPRQAAMVVGCSATAFAVRLHRARRRLARTLRAPASDPARMLRVQQEVR
jgi:RNA polymerase sigma-70 factor, ECF subfamily